MRTYLESTGLIFSLQKNSSWGDTRQRKGCIPVEVWPVLVALDPAPLHHSGEHDDEGALLLPRHVPELGAGVGQRPLHHIRKHIMRVHRQFDRTINKPVLRSGSGSSYGPYVFVPYGSGSRYISGRYGSGSGSGSGSFFHQAKVVRKFLIPTAL
jgi:hypothetical protein